MKLIPGRRAQSLDDAIQLAFGETGRQDMSPELARLFMPALDAERLAVESEKRLHAAVHARFGPRAERRGQRWLVPLPQPGYDEGKPPCWLSLLRRTW